MPASTQGPGDPSALYDNQWRLTRLGGAEVVLKDAPREAHLVFFPGGNLNGADGCNAIRGGFETRGDSLTIKTPLMGTLMTCTLPDDLDRRFLEALARVRKWRVTNLDLELLDDTGTTLARFEALPR